jgi:hypothetical protein
MTKGDGTSRRTMGTNKGKQLPLGWMMGSNKGTIMGVGKDNKE